MAWLDDAVAAAMEGLPLPPGPPTPPRSVPPMGVFLRAVRALGCTPECLSNFEVFKLLVRLAEADEMRRMAAADSTA